MWGIKKASFPFWVDFLFSVFGKSFSENAEIFNVEDKKTALISFFSKNSSIPRTVGEKIVAFLTSSKEEILSEISNSDWCRKGFLGLREDEDFFLEEEKFAYFFYNLTSKKLSFHHSSYLPVTGRVFFYHPDTGYTDLSSLLKYEPKKRSFFYQGEEVKFEEKEDFKIRGLVYGRKLALSLYLDSSERVRGDSLVIKTQIPFFQSSYEWEGEFSLPHRYNFYFTIDRLALEENVQIEEVTLYKGKEPIFKKALGDLKVEFLDQLDNKKIVELAIEEKLEDFLLTDTEKEELEKLYKKYGLMALEYERLYRKVQCRYFLEGYLKKMSFPLQFSGGEIILDPAKILKIRRELSRYYLYYPHLLGLEGEEEVMGREARSYKAKIILEKVADLGRFIELVYQELEEELQNTYKKQIEELLQEVELEGEVEFTPEGFYLNQGSKKRFLGSYGEDKEILREKLKRLKKDILLENISLKNGMKIELLEEILKFIEDSWGPLEIENDTTFSWKEGKLILKEEGIYFDYQGKKYGPFPLEKAKDKIRKILFPVEEDKNLTPLEQYIKMLKSFFSDGYLSGEELKQLKEMALGLHLTRTDVEEAFKRVIFPVLQEEILRKLPGIVNEKKFIESQRKYVFTCKILGEFFFMIEYYLKGGISFLLKFLKDEKVPYQLFKTDGIYNWYRVELKDVRSLADFLQLIKKAYNTSVLSRVKYLKEKLGEQLKIEEFLQVIKTKLNFQLPEDTIDLIRKELGKWSG